MVSLVTGMGDNFSFLLGCGTSNDRAEMCNFPGTYFLQQIYYDWGKILQR
jgi:hypothetical protein